MSRYKVFSLKIDNTGVGALKESAQKYTRDNMSRIKVVFGLDSELRIVEPSIYKDGVFIGARVIQGKLIYDLKEFLEECKTRKNSIYFPVNNLTYVCEHTVNIQDGEVIKSHIRLYLPNDINDTGLLCNDVTVAFPIQNRNALSSNYLNYTLTRI